MGVSFPKCFIGNLGLGKFLIERGFLTIQQLFDARNIVNRTFILSLLFSLTVLAQEPPLKRIDFKESVDVFPNPERGFYRYTSLANLTSLPDLQKESVTLIFGKIAANSFRDRDFSQSFLTQIQRGFDVSRSRGVKVNVRVSYCDDIGQPDASKEQIFRHIDQLKPLFEKNKDVINLVEAGFIGAWGEWHSSTHGLDTPQNRRDILFKLLSVLPRDRMVVLRTPHFKRQIFNDSLLSESRAFDGTYLSRVGFHNDCFLSSSDDMGTYVERSREQEIRYIGGETRYTPFGGETCALSNFSHCPIAMDEMEKLHCSYLNDGYHPSVLALWQSENCIGEIKKRLGYRFVLRDAEISARIRPGGVLFFRFAIENVGFAAPFNPRQAFLVLRENNTGQEAVAAISVDPRTWLPGDTLEFSRRFRIPAAWPAGTCTISLWLPDAENALQNNPRYAVRFANVDIWGQDRGTNQITDSLLIDPTAPGETDSQAKDFSEIDTPAGVIGMHENPEDFSLKVFPNPFYHLMNVQFWLHKAEPVELSVYNVQGQRICTLAEGYQTEGSHNVNWDGSGNGMQAASGVYFIRLQTPSQMREIRILYLK